MNKPTRFVLAEPGPARFTSAEFAKIFSAAAQLDIRLELVDGEVQRMSPPQGAHSSRQTSLIAMLWAVVGNRVMVEAAVDFGESTVLTCDLAVLRAPMADHRFLSPKEVVLAIEVADTTIGRDLGLKLSRYASAAIPFYWVVDSNRRVIHVHAEPDGDEYKAPATVRFGEPLAVPGTDQTIVIA